MAKLQFIQPDGTTSEVEIDDGISVMEGAVRAGIDGIDADCGGQLACATCHVHIDRDWLQIVSELSPLKDDEREMLSFAEDTDETSRLSCQLLVSAPLDGLKVIVPKAQG